MTKPPDLWTPQPGNWTVEQAVRHLAFGHQGISPIPEGMGQIELVRLRDERQGKAIAAAYQLQEALNKRRIRAWGCGLPGAMWGQPLFAETGVTLEDSALLERPIRAKGDASRLKWRVDLTARYTGVGIALALEDEAAGLMSIRSLYVCVELPEAKVKELKRWLDSQMANRNAGQPKKIKVGRPGIPERVLEIYREREESGNSASMVIEEAAECCRLYTKETTEDINPETVARKISAARKNRMPAI